MRLTSWSSAQPRNPASCRMRRSGDGSSEAFPEPPTPPNPIFFPLALQGAMLCHDAMTRYGGSLRTGQDGYRDDEQQRQDALWRQRDHDHRQRRDGL